MDVTPFLSLDPAPRAVFDALDERRTRPRFMIPTGDGDWRAVTWGAYADQIRAIACYLASVGVTTASRVAIYAPNRVEWIAAALGIQAAGGAMVPVYPASTAEQLGYIVEHGDVEVLFVDTAPLLRNVIAAWGTMAGVRKIVLLDDDLDAASLLKRMRDAEGGDLPSFAEVEPKIVTWTAAIAHGEARDDEEPDGFQSRLHALDLDQPAVMLYTSGTTGLPKGVPLTHRNVAINGRDWLQCNGPLLDEQAVDLLWLPMSHIFGFGEACLGNTLGFTTYLADPRSVLQLLPEVRPTVFMSVPAYWEKLALPALRHADKEARRKQVAESTGGRLTFCLSGGAGLKREVKELFYECGLLIIEGYGLTECSPTLTLNRPDDFRFDSVGKPLPSVELKLADDGEILAKGPTVFGGYHKNEEATKEAFTDDGWFKTGDVGRWTEDGFLQIIDRKKEILVTAGGKNVPPANIEQRFADEPLFAHVVAYGDGKKFITAGIWLDAEAVDAALGDVDTKDRKAAIDALVAAAVEKGNDQLARYEQIKKWRVMDTPLTVARGLLTSTLKIRRKKIYEAFRDDFEELYTA